MEEPISMFEVSQRIGITCRQMERIFKEELGKSPLRVRDRLRVRRAKRLLLETDLNFTEIAVACGLLGTKTLNGAFAREEENCHGNFGLHAPVCHRIPRSDETRIDNNSPVRPAYSNRTFLMAFKILGFKYNS